MYARRRRGRSLDLGPFAGARWLPLGPRADPRVAAPAPARGGLRGLRRARRPPTPALAGELGDLLLQIVLHAQLAAEEGVFDLTDVYEAIGSKIVRRHPHVFGDAEARTAGDVNRQWEQIKKAERAEAAAAGDEPGPTEPATPKSALDGISRSMPALAASQEMQERAANLGYDWPTVDGIVDKVREELDELLAAETSDERREELGDLLLVAVNLGRRHGVEAETALRAGEREVPATLPERGAPGGGAGRGAARPRLRSAGRTVGCREGRGARDMTIGRPARNRFGPTAGARGPSARHSSSAC